MSFDGDDDRDDLGSEPPPCRAPNWRNHISGYCPACGAPRGQCWWDDPPPEPEDDEP